MHVEFLGVPRERAGVSELEVQADTLGQLLGTLAARIPSLCANSSSATGCTRRSSPI